MFLFGVLVFLSFYKFMKTVSRGSYLKRYNTNSIPKDLGEKFGGDEKDLSNDEIEG